jgi:hypothetical protein
VLRFFRWILIPVLLLDALLINSFVRYGFPAESVPVETQAPLSPGESVMRFRREDMAKTFSSAVEAPVPQDGYARR